MGNFRGVCPFKKNGRKGGKEMASEKIRIRLKAFDHQALDQSAEKIVEKREKDRCQCIWSNSATY